MLSSPARFIFVLSVVHFAGSFSAGIAEDVSQAGKRPPEVLQENGPRPDNSEHAYELPDGGVEELIAFVIRLRKEETADADYAKKIAAIVAAGRKIDERASDADRKLDGYDEAIGIWLYVAVFETRLDEERARLIQSTRSYLASSASISRLASAAAMAMIEWFAKTPDRATAVGREFVEALAESKDPQAASHTRKLEGTMRRLTLLGQTVTIRGTAMDGKPLDFSSMRGKVVLVDFWATWCGPCLAEVPNIKHNYDLYHERGFEVIGISMDEDRTALEEHLAQHPSPWITLHDPIADEDHVARYYGITSLPTLILIDQNGKAVSVHVRGTALGTKLVELLGSAPEADEAARDASE